MGETSEPTAATDAETRGQMFLPGAPAALTVTFDLAAGAMRFEWSRVSDGIVARGNLAPAGWRTRHTALTWRFEAGSETKVDGCGIAPPSTRALMKRARTRMPFETPSLRIGMLSDAALGPVPVDKWTQLSLPPRSEPWKWLETQVRLFATMTLTPRARAEDEATCGRHALRLLACLLFGLSPSNAYSNETPAPEKSRLRLRVTFDLIEGTSEFVWSDSHTRAIAAAGLVRRAGPERLGWELTIGETRAADESSHRRDSIRAALARWLARFPHDSASFTAFFKKPQAGTAEPLWEQEPPFGASESVPAWIEENLVAMAEDLRFRFSPLGRAMQEMDLGTRTALERQARRLQRKEQQRANEVARREAHIARATEERRRREEQERTSAAHRHDQAAPAHKHAHAPTHTSSHAPAPAPPREPAPPVSVAVRLPPLEFQETLLPLTNLGSFALRERAALWWISNQSDDLLCLPHCRITRLDYQIRAALRVLGPLRGRALLSDEVGLGKTIEAGLVLKELLTRGMVKRFLILTLPSLVDQWAEELADKFGIATVTTNHADARADANSFWSENPAIVASLHTLKQPAQLEIARAVHWDFLLVDEAHHLRNRASQAWQAVNVLPRQFLLLLTATPVQNSLEELYNLVTLLQPGQLPAPREFRARFLDPQRPRQPREPEELRRLLGQVMIRNTRANAGIDLPPRHAETVLVEPDDADAAFWREWETEFRASLARLSVSQASLWGRLLLQAAGSSPAAWRAALAKFPDANSARAWRGRAPLESGWRRKCELLAPLARTAGGVVIFTQFLETQAALAEFLRSAELPVFVINGSTPAPERQPITDEFRQRGGALLLTHSGTEGRNLQFCHCLANFDLPWNPMEIEQRIGRLHRLGQTHPVRITNFVQAGTLQEHLLQILQEKLNLFELVVGETGLVLGDRYSGDEFEEELLRRWRENEGRVAEAFAGLGDELAAARGLYDEVKQLDETLFAKDFESL